MGRFVAFHCRFCNYREERVGVGQGRSEFPLLKLYTCDNCHSFGSTWIHRDRPPACSVCYHEAIRILDDETKRLPCPKCGETALVTPIEGEWQ